MQFRASLIAAVVALCLAGVSAFVPAPARVAHATRVFGTDMPAIGEMDKEMTQKLRMEVKDIEEMALKKLEGKYAELKGKLADQKAGVTEPNELASIKDAVSKKVRASLGIEEDEE